MSKNGKMKKSNATGEMMNLLLEVETGKRTALESISAARRIIRRACLRVLARDIDWDNERIDAAQDALKEDRRQWIVSHRPVQVIPGTFLFTPETAVNGDMLKKVHAVVSAVAEGRRSAKDASLALAKFFSEETACRVENALDGWINQEF